MKRRHVTTAAALLGLGLFCGCASTTNPCGERQGLFSRWFGGANRNGGCECVETGRVSVGEGPIIADPGCGAPAMANPFIPTMPPATALPTPNQFAPPLEAKPSSTVKDAAK